VIHVRICGKLTHKDGGVTEDLLRRMNTVLAHRGPDDEVSISTGVATVGVHPFPWALPTAPQHHRSVSAGRQPMSNEDETVRMVFNGEIYNFQALRDELKKKGHCFRSDTDGK